MILKKIILFVIILFVKGSVFACTCIGKGEVKTEIINADAIVVGQIISKEFVIITHTSARVISESEYLAWQGFGKEKLVAKYLLVSTAKYKGEILSDTIEVYTGLGGGDCGVHFVIGKNYVIYGQSESYFGGKDHFAYPCENNIIWTNICWRTGVAHDTEILEIEKYIKKE